MVPRYEEARGARFTVESVGRAQRFTIKPARNLLWAGLLAVSGAALAGVGASVIPALLFLLRPPPLPGTLPLVGVERFFPATLHACLVVVVLGLAFALSFLLFTLFWMLGGAEILDVSDGDLAVTHRALGFARTRRYRGEDISDVAGHVALPLRQSQASIPLLWAATTGSVRFTYGARTVYLAQGLDFSEGRLLAASLRESLASGGARRRRNTEL